MPITIQPTMITYALLVALDTIDSLSAACAIILLSPPQQNQKQKITKLSPRPFNGSNPTLGFDDRF